MREVKIEFWTRDNRVRLFFNENQIKKMRNASIFPLFLIQLCSARFGIGITVVYQSKQEGRVQEDLYYSISSLVVRSEVLPLIRPYSSNNFAGTLISIIASYRVLAKND